MRLYLCLFLLFFCPVSASAQKIVVEKTDTSRGIVIATDYNPRFKGGDIFAYINQHITFPTKLSTDSKGKIIVSFIVEKTGEAGKFKIVRSANPLIDSTIVDALSGSKWIPARSESCCTVRVLLSLHMDVLADSKQHILVVKRHIYKDTARDTLDNLSNYEREPYPFRSMLLYQYLSKKMVYPAEELKNKKGSLQEVVLKIDERGSISEIRFIGSMAEPFKTTFIRAIRNYRFEQRFKPVKQDQEWLFINFNPKRPHNFDTYGDDMYIQYEK